MLAYPALLEFATRKLHPLGVSESYLVGRNETADLCVLDPACARHHFRLMRHEGRYQVERLNVQNPTYHNGVALTGPMALTHGDYLQAGQSRFRFLLHPADGTTEQPPELVAAPTALAGTAAAEQTLLPMTVFLLTGTMLLGRERARVQIFLPHPQVSRCHARLVSDGTTTTLTDLNSANGTFVNGQRLQEPTVLQAGDQLDIGPYTLQFTGTALLPRPRSDNVELVARGVTRVVANRQTGQPLSLLDDITLVIRPREFVCLLGPSGSGKSTLLAALSGRTPGPTHHRPPTFLAGR